MTEETINEIKWTIHDTHPEVCTMDQTLISKMLALPANKIQCILDGGPHCTYVVQPADAKN